MLHLDLQMKREDRLALAQEQAEEQFNQAGGGMLSAPSPSKSSFFGDFASGAGTWLAGVALTAGFGMLFNSLRKD